MWEESKNAVLGIVLTMLSTILQSIQMSISGRVMSGRSGKLNSFQLTFYTGPRASPCPCPSLVALAAARPTRAICSSPGGGISGWTAAPRLLPAVAFVTLVPMAFATEWNVFAESMAYRPGATVGFLLGSCCVAVVYNVVLFQSIHTLSSVGTAILGNVKIVCLLFLSSLLLGELGTWSANQYLGCLLTFVSAFVFSYLKATANRPAPQVAPQPDQKQGGGN